jgi:hypothetical protein
MILKTISEDCRNRRKNLNVTWVDYEKAFDNVPRSWLEKSIELIGVNNKLVEFC